MEQFRDKIKMQNLTIGVCCIILSLFCFFAAAGEAGLLPFFTPVSGDSHWQSMWRGFCCGAAFGVLAILVFGLVRNIRALLDEKALKKLYVQEHDERSIQVWTSARAAAYQTGLLLGLVAILISGYFNPTVSITLVATITGMSVLGLLFKLYYSIKF